MNTSFGFLYNQRNLFLKIIQIESEHLKTVSTFNYLQFPKITWSGFTTFLLLLLHAFTDLCIVVLLIFAFCIFIFCIFLWDPTWFCPGPIALSLPLLCADFLCLSLESNLSTCSLINRTCIFICLYLYFSWKNLSTCYLISRTCIYIFIRTFLENNLSTCSPICKNFYVWNKFKGKELNRDSTAVEKKSLKIV